MSSWCTPTSSKQNNMLTSVICLQIVVSIQIQTMTSQLVTPTWIHPQVCLPVLSLENSIQQFNTRPLEQVWEQDCPELDQKFDWHEEWSDISPAPHSPDHQQIQYDLYMGHTSRWLLTTLCVPHVQWGTCLHMMWDCPPVSLFWSNVASQLSAVIHVTVPVTVSALILNELCTLIFSLFNSTKVVYFTKTEHLTCKSTWTLGLVACCSSFRSHYFNQMSSVTTNQSLASAYGDFCPLLLAELSQLREVGGTSGMYQLLQVSPQHFNWIKVRTLTGPIQSTNPLSLKPFLCSFARMLWVIVLLCNPFSSQLQLPDWWQEILVKNLLMCQRIHGSLDNMESSRSRSRKATPDLHISITMLHCWEEVIFFICSVGFSPNMVVLIVTKLFYSDLSVQRVNFQKCLLVKLKPAALFFFESTGFLLATLPWYHGC